MSPTSLMLQLFTCLMSGPCRQRINSWMKHNLLLATAITGWFVTTGFLIAEVLKDPIVIRETVVEHKCPATPVVLQDDPPDPTPPTLPTKPEPVIITRPATGDANLKGYIKDRLKSLTDPDL